MISENRLHRPGFALCVRLGIYHKAAMARTAKGSGLAPEELAAAMAQDDRMGARLRRRLYSEVIAICGEKERRRSV